MAGEAVSAGEGGEDRLRLIRDWQARHHYFKYLANILLGARDEEGWLTGAEICRDVTDQSRAGFIRDTKGSQYKGLCHRALWQELKGVFVQCDQVPPEDSGAFFPWYKARRFRLAPAWRADVKVFIDELFGSEQM
jgi:hypothetical protein